MCTCNRQKEIYCHNTHRPIQSHQQCNTQTNSGPLYFCHLCSYSTVALITCILYKLYLLNYTMTNPTRSICGNKHFKGNPFYHDCILYKSALSNQEGQSLGNNHYTATGKISNSNYCRPNNKNEVFLVPARLLFGRRLLFHTFHNSGKKSPPPQKKACDIHFVYQ